MLMNLIYKLDKDKKKYLIIMDNASVNFNPLFISSVDKYLKNNNNIKILQLNSNSSECNMIERVNYIAF